GIGELAFDGFAYLTQGLPAVYKVAIGSGHICALTADRCVWGWGDNSFDQLGNPDISGAVRPVHLKEMDAVVDIAAYDHDTVALGNDGRVQWWGGDAPWMLDEPSALWVQGGPYVSVDIGDRFGCGLRSDGIVECWGKNDYGQLGTGDTAD